MSNTKRIQADYASGIDAPRNYIREGNFDHGTKGFSVYREEDAVTFTIATDEVGLVGHGLFVGQKISFTAIAGGTTNIAVDTEYFVKSIVSADAFTIAATKGGATIDLDTSDGTGTLVRDRPKLGTGGSPTITLTRVTSSPLKGSASGLITKPASNKMGEGISYSFTVDRKHQAKVLYQQFLYEVASGAYTDSALSAFVYGPIDGTPVVTELSPRDIQNSSLIEQFDSAFQTALVGTQYRLCLHISSPDVVAYTMKVDEFKSVEKRGIKNSIVTDWVEYTPAITGLGTVTNLTAYWRDVGGNREVQGTVTAGTTTAVEARIPLPSGTIDSLKFPTQSVVGSVAIDNFAVSFFQNQIVARGGDSYVCFTKQDNTVGGYTIGNADTTISNGAILSFKFSVPITGLGATTEIFGDADTRVIAAKYAIAAAVPSDPTQPIDFATKIFDTLGIVSTGSSWGARIPTPGIYEVSSVLATGTTTSYLEVYKNGVNSGFLGDVVNTAYRSMSTLIECNSGDLIDLRLSSSQNTDATSFNTITIKKLLGPSQIAASEKISAAIGLTSNYTVAANDPIIFDTVLKDSHGGYSTSTGGYSVPSPGDFRFSFVGTTNAATASIYVVKNSDPISYITRIENGVVQSGDIIFSDCKIGDVLYVFSEQAATLVGSTSPFQCYLSIEKL